MAQVETGSLEAQAIKLARRGFPVFPLHTPTGDEAKPCSCNKADCSNVGKHPRTVKGLLDATTDEIQIAKWWAMWPQANIAIVTGAVSGVIVLDVDPKNGGIDTLKGLIDKHGFVNERSVVKTGSGGFHYFFKHPGGRIGNTQGSKTKASYLGFGLDLRGDGGYVVASGSLHESGKRYEWSVDLPQWPEMPAWLRSMIDKHQTQATTVSTVSLGAGEPLESGSRHPQLLQWAAKMRQAGLSTDAILAGLRIENATRCVPPKDDAEIIKIANWIGGKPPGEVLEAVQAEVAEDEVSEALKTVDHYEERLDALFKNGFQKGLHPGWDSLAEIFTVEPGHPTLVTGSPTAGKSSLVNAWMVHMGMAYDWRVLYSSPEFHPPEYHILRCIESYSGASAQGTAYADKLQQGDFDSAKQWMKQHMFFAEPAKAQKRTVKLALQAAERQSVKTGCNAVVLDPWASFSHPKQSGARADEALADEINQIVEFGLRTKITPIIVLHPHQMLPDKDGKYPVVKPYDLNGGAMWYNLFYNMLSLYRDASWDRGEVEIYVWKVKYHWLGKNNKSCKLFYQPSTGRYTESALGETRPWYQQPKRNQLPEF
jgi:hypothetical protein